MRRRVILVGLLLSLLTTPIVWAEDTTAGQDEGFWGFDWLHNVVSWVQSIIEGPDPIPQGETTPLEIQDSEEVQSIPEEQDRSGGIDPTGNK